MNTHHSSRERRRSAGAADSTRLAKIVRDAGLALCVASVACIGLTACEGSNGGSNGNPDYQKKVDQASGLLFSYPFNGQQNVTPTTQIVLKADAAFDGDSSGAFALQSTDGNASHNVDVSISHDNNQPGIYRIDPARPLFGNTTYRLVARRSLKANNTTFASGDTLFQFKTSPIPGRPSSGNFQVTDAAPGDVNPVTGQTSAFAQFDTVHVALSEAVDPATVVKGQSFKFTNSNGDEVNGTLTVSGNAITFDPSDNLAPGTYTIALSDDVKSAFGKSLQGFSAQRTVLDTGKIVQQNLLVDNDQGFSGDNNDSPLDGQPDNLVTLRTQLIGTNQQPARNTASRGGVLANLGQAGMPGFGNQFPTSIPAGQTFELKPLNLKLNGNLQTPVQSGPIKVQFGSDANVYLQANDYRSLVAPTAVRLRFDLNNTTLISAAPGTPDYIVQALANGLINQSALNVQAAGLALPQKNGDLLISTVGSFPLAVNRTDTLTVDFSLTLRLPARDQIKVQPDTQAPFITAQVPSACFYVSGTPAYGATYNQIGASPIALPEQQCVGILQAGGAAQTASGIDSAALDGDIALTFSEPLDPLTVNSRNIQLSGNGNNVPVTFTTDGSSVTIHPQGQLAADTQYTVSLNTSGLTDVAGNALQQVTNGGPGQTIAFTTEPMVDTTPAPVLLGQLSPGLACAVTGGNFASGGNTTGHCVGDTPQSGNSDDYPVATSPVNVPVNAYFSKPVARDSVVLANGCLTGGSGKNNTRGNATVALERVDGNGQCLGAAPAQLAFADNQADTTNGFSIRPVGELEPDARYWVVVCGTERGTPATSCSAQIVDNDGLKLNTDPLNGTGSNDDGSGASAGGPDIVVPFDTTGFSSDYYADQFTLPATDTNGNGQFDDANGNGQYDAGGTDERPQPSNVTLLSLSLLGTQLQNPNRSDGKYPSYSALNRPIAIRKTLSNCSAAQAVTNDNGDSAVGSSIDQCIRVSLLPGGINDLTAVGVSQSAALNAIVGIIPGLIQNLVNQGAITSDTPLGPVLTGIAQGLTAGLLNGGSGSAGLSPTELMNQLGATIVGNINKILQGQGSGTTPNNGPTVGDLLNGSLGSLTDANNLAAPLAMVVDQLRGGLQLVAGMNGDTVNTGRIILRYPDQAGNGSDTGTQSGYIVPKCSGKLNGQNYDYEPCFVASLRLTVNAPDGVRVALNQQQITANVVGPVAFEQNGRLVIPLRNANQIQLNATALGSLPTTATIAPGALNLQLAGNAAHGGVAFPER